MASISANGSRGHHKFTLNVNETATSTANNTSTITWSLVLSSLGGNYDWNYSNTVPVTYAVIVNGQSYTGNIMKYDGSSTVTVASGTLTVPHNADGTKTITFSFSISSINASYLPGSASANGSMALTNIPRAATITSAPNFTDIQNPTITYSNAAGSAASSLQACISLTGAVDDIPYRAISVTGSSYTFELTDAERNTLRQAAANSKTLTVYFYLATTINGTIYRNNVARTLTIVNANPTFSCSYQDTNSTTTAVTGNNQQIIRNQSSLRVSISNATALKYATLSSANVVINGTTYNGTLSNGACTFNIGTINVASNTAAAVTVTDSRGNSTTQNLTLQVLDWTAPTALISAQRESNYYSATSVTANASYASLDSKNTLTIKARYKKVGNATWSTYTTMQNNVASTFTLDNAYEWDLQVQVADKFASTTYNLVVPVGMPLVFFDDDKYSVGINCFPVNNKSLEVNGVNVVRSVMTRCLTADLSNLTANSYVKINLTGSNSFGSALTATNDGGIQIGAGVSKILVSGRMLISSAVVGLQAIRIAKNDATVYDNMLAWVSHTNTSTSAAFETIDAAPAIVDVEEGDVIYLYYYVPDSSATIYGNSRGNQTSLTVETVG